MNAKLREGLKMRSPEKNEADKASVIFNNYDAHINGEKNSTEEVILKTWEFPNFDLKEDARIIVDENDKWLGFIAVWNDNKPHIQNFIIQKTEPEYIGSDIETVLLEWAEEKSDLNIPKAPADGEVYAATTVDSTQKDKIQNLKDRGYSEIRYFWRMGIDLNTDLDQPEFPEGISITTHKERQNLMDIVKCDRAGFADHWGYYESPIDEEFAEWKHWISMEPYYDPQYWFLALSDNNIIGMSLCMNGMVSDKEIAYLDSLCVNKEFRKKGIASSLLKLSFAEMKKAGRKKVYLHVDADSLTGATRLYESVGMKVNQSSTKMEKIIRKGKSYRTENL